MQIRETKNSKTTTNADSGRGVFVPFEDMITKFHGEGNSIETGWAFVPVSKKDEDVLLNTLSSPE